MTYFITIAGRRWPVETNFQDGEGRPRLGPVPVPHLGRDQPAHRPDRPRPAQDRRHPGRPRRPRRRPAAASQDTPATPDETTVNPADLQIYTGDAPLPNRGGQPCPPGIPPITLSAAETARIDRLARDWKAGLLTAARLAFHLRWSAWRRRHQTRARWHHYAARLAALAT